MVSPRSLIFIAAFLALFAGALMAISGAQTAGVNVNSRWSGSTASYNATQGGNITMLNLSMTSLTTRWAAYWGNVTGTIILGTATNNIYQWSVSASSMTGRVCVSQGASQTFSTPTNASVSSIDNAANFSFGSAADNATSTYNLTSCNVVLSTGTVLNVASAKHQGNSTFTTCAITSDARTGVTSFDFCTNISKSGISFNNTGTNYELLVPTVANSTLVNNYYFYAELG